MRTLHVILPIVLSSLVLILLVRLPSSSSSSSTPTPTPTHITSSPSSSSASPWLPLNLSLSSVSSPAFTPSPCRYASLYPPSSLLTNATVRTQFLLDMLYWEGQFLHPNPCGPFRSPASYVGLHNLTAVSLDGHRLAVDTGLPVGDPHPFTAASKESLHVALLAIALSATPAAPLASLFLSPSSPSSASSLALAHLRVKVNSYDLFNCRYPGFGGFLPWVHVNDSGLAPQDGWERTVPGLDNGQLIWAALALTRQLETKWGEELHTPLMSPQCAWSPDWPLLSSPNTTLAQRWRLLITRWRSNLMTIFYDGKGRFRDVAHLRNATDPRIIPSQYSSDPECDDACYLDDPYEGELFTVFAYLYCDWGGDDRQQLWLRKRAKLQPATLKLSNGTAVTVQRGFWYSAHELWTHLMLPYRDVPINDRLFVLGEKARLAWSAQQRIPGLYASVNGLAPTDDYNFPYNSDCGVQQLASQPVTTQEIVTPYGTMNLMMLLYPSRSSPLPPVNSTTPIGLAWLANSIRSNRGQSCFGVTEGSAVNGTMVAPLKTWDTTVTTVLGVLGGVVDMVREVMEVDDVYDTFVDVVDTEWMRVFGGEGVLKGDELGWPLPSAEIPNAQKEWTSCTVESAVCVCDEKMWEEHVKKGPREDARTEANRHPADHSWSKYHARRGKCGVRTEDQ